MDVPKKVILYMGHSNEQARWAGLSKFRLYSGGANFVINLIPSMVKISKNTISNTANFDFGVHTCTCFEYQHGSAVDTSAYAYNFLTYEY